MVELGHHDLVAGPESATEHPPEVEGQRRHVGAEDDLAGRAADEVGERLAGGAEGGVGLRARGIDPVGVRVVAQQVLRHRVHDGARDLRAAGPVEVGDGSSPVSPLEGGEVAADLVEAGDALGGGGGCGGHGGTSQTPDREG
jgi:hypothetical protein